MHTYEIKKKHYSYSLKLESIETHLK